MIRLSAAMLAIGLAASGSAFAQSAYSQPPDDGYYGNDGYNDGYNGAYGGAYSGAQRGDAYYDYAQVIRVDPVIGGYRGAANPAGQRCYENRSAGGYEGDGYYGDNEYPNGGYRNGGYYGNASNGGSRYGGTPGGRTAATVVGGIAGAVLGSRFGGGSGAYAATAIGSMVGGIAGQQVYDNAQRDRRVPTGIVRVCEPEPVGNGYYRRTGDGRASAYDVTYEYNGRRYTRRMDYHPGDRVRVRVDVSPQ
jgi:uncharacterized protein YcfJ